MTRPFEELRILEIAGSHAGAYAAKMFADNGADVVKLVPPAATRDGTTARSSRITRWVRAEVGSIWAFCNTSKRVVEADLDDESARRLLAAADVVIESSAPDPLRPHHRHLDDDRLIRLYLSPFGLTGPWAERRSNVFTDDAAGGHLYLNGEPDREPFRRHGRHTEYQAGMYGFIGSLAALIARERTGRGQVVEVAHLEGMVSMHQHTTTMWTHAGYILKREGNTQPGMWHPAGCYECADGYVFLSHAGGAKLVPFLHAAGLGHLLDDPRVRHGHRPRTATRRSSTRPSAPG